MAPDSSELLQFQSEHSANTFEALHGQLADTDRGMARLTEDLIDTLINKGVIKFTDLPPAAGAKYLERQAKRQKLTAIQSLVADEKDIF